MGHFMGLKLVETLCSNCLKHVEVPAQHHHDGISRLHTNAQYPAP